MERLQREIHETAQFTDRFEFNPARLGPTDSREGIGAGDTEPASDAQRPLVAGVDQAFLDDRAVSAVVVTRGATVVERVHAVTRTPIPYVPGLLAFREGGPILAAVEQLSVEPDLFLFDGNGRIHRRGAGLATHLGVTLNVPAVGVAKSLLCGTVAGDRDGRPVGWQATITADESCAVAADTVLGHAVQTRQYDSRPIVNPVYVSPGHRVSPATAVRCVTRTCAGYKLPEPIRRADSVAESAKTDYE